MTKKEILKEEVHFILMIMLLLLLAFIIILEESSTMNEKSDIMRDDFLDMIDQRMNGLFQELNSFPSSIGSDVLFMTEISSFAGFIHDESNESKAKLENDFLKFMGTSYTYYRFGLIDDLGQERLRIEFDGEKYDVSSFESYISFKENPIYLNSLKLSEGDVYISNIYLVEEENGDELPIISASMPVYNGKFEGIIYLDLNIDYFLEDIRNFQREGEITYLIDGNGTYLANPNKSKEFSSNDNFFKEYPLVKKVQIADFEKRIETENNIFSFKYLTPTSWDEHIYSASEKNNLEYVWTLVSISDKKIINKLESETKKVYTSFMLFFVLIILCMLILLFIIWRKKK